MGSQKLAKLVRREPFLDRNTAESMREDTPHMFTLKGLDLARSVGGGPEHQAVSAPATCYFL